MRTAMALVTLAACVPAARAEVPPWDEVEGRLLVVRRHCAGETYTDRYDGLWSFDPDTATYARLAPLSFNSGCSFPTKARGFGGLLVGTEGRLVYQAWPYNLELDLATGRLLRRVPPLLDPAAEGWTIQGPVVWSQVAETLAMAPGVYGLPLCLRIYLDSGGFTFPPLLDCPSYVFPGDSGNPSGCYWDPPTTLLGRALEADDDGLWSAATVTPQWCQGGYSLEATFVPPVLSLDVAGSRLWRGTPDGVEVLPIESGQVLPASVTHRFDFSPFGQGEVVLDALYFDPTRQRLFGSTWGWPASSLSLFSLDDELGNLVTYPLDVELELAHGLGAGLPATFASAGPRPETFEQLVPIVARAAGRNGTVWSTDLWLYNPSAEATTVSVRRVATPGAAEAVFELGPRSSRAIPDVLAWLGGGPEGDGVAHDALVLTAPFRWGEQVVAAARVYTVDPGGGGGSLGQAVPAVPGRLGYSNHLLSGAADGGWFAMYHDVVGRQASLSLDRLQPGRFRHNLGAVNDADEVLDLTLMWGYDAMEEHELEQVRPPDSYQHVRVAPHAVAVVDVEALFPETVRQWRPPRLAVFGQRPAALWLSVVDNSTGDASFVPFTDYHRAANHDDERVAIPVAAHGPGRNGTWWRTDLYGVEGSHLLGAYDQPRAYFHPSDPAHDCGGAAVQGEIGADLVGVQVQELPHGVDEVGWKTVFPDVVRLFPACASEDDARGGLEVVSGTWTTGWSRTYTTTPDGGTYGEMLPFYPHRGWPVQHFAGVVVSPALRANLGLFNGDHDHPVTHRLLLYREDGSLAAQRELTLAPLASVQGPLAVMLGLPEGDLPDGLYGLTVLPLDDPSSRVEGRCWAYVSLVDQVTGDPTNWW